MMDQLFRETLQGPRPSTRRVSCRASSRSTPKALRARRNALVSLEEDQEQMLWASSGVAEAQRPRSAISRAFLERGMKRKGTGPLVPPSLLPTMPSTCSRTPSMATFDLAATRV